MIRLYEMMAALLAEYRAYAAAVDKAAHVRDRAKVIYDVYIGPIDIPIIPDSIEEKIVDPMGRTAFVAVVVALHQAVLLRSDGGLGWPEPVIEEPTPCD